ncbi:phosphatase PAP2 family protein [Spirosoma agri]|uniref:Phosphatase PAP2 family protein n=1 Tax=Spirosoma agri TaxID=1987381 RepID=A0A6M0IS02_9BACT|nr:phosphatase PAP2 family protein [Spirosoma agri]NEU70864.1 phosphatase PAP2 family protein [Spirosoma agri]
MQSVSPWLTKTARIVSAVGHPLFVTSLFTLAVAFDQLTTLNALLVSGLLLGGVIGPVTWQNYQRTKRGLYTNFDVSDRQQRYRFYPILIALLGLVTTLLFVTQQPRPFCIGFLSVLLLVVCSYGINFFCKVSLHTSISFFMVWALRLISLPLGVGMGILALLIAASRLVLSRHSLTELVVGALLGLLAGAGFYGYIR